MLHFYLMNPFVHPLSYLKEPCPRLSPHFLLLPADLAEPDHLGSLASLQCARVPSDARGHVREAGQTGRRDERGRRGQDGRRGCMRRRVLKVARSDMSPSSDKALI
jgi:hypothetical protein